MDGSRGPAELAGLGEVVAAFAALRVECRLLLALRAQRALTAAEGARLRALAHEADRLRFRLHRLQVEAARSA